ncbi:hypothetical protein, variant [Blastomyces dermatitidis ATCC 18188]|uniref:HNH nuclease domain-containing protein n=1 Tax=Ajellomyces dermatitidis (strain ATCC 18188 / CBS 674.68) TaxID=653446 RepID=A0A0J9ESC8_AJEDA|nr:hypothetical protein, variant [Blastomyces dermatitidis ATCC 18188]
MEKFNVLKDIINSQYNHCLVVQYTHEYSCSAESKDMYLHAFFNIMPVNLNGNEDIHFSNENLEQQLREAFIEFAEYLLDNFFLLCKKPPQPSPAPHSTARRALGTRVCWNTRSTIFPSGCLPCPTHHRCVISRKFDFKEAATRVQKNDDGVRDNDGALLKDDPQAFETPQVAHILPHSLMKIEDAYWSKLKTGLSTPSLTPTLHNLFGGFQMFFEPVSTQLPHVYKIGSYLLPFLLRDPVLPVTRELYLSEERTIDLPLPQLLAIHSAIAHVLHLFASGEYIDRLLRNQEEIGVKADGSTELGRLIKLRLSGWITSGCLSHLLTPWKLFPVPTVLYSLSTIVRFVRLAFRWNLHTNNVPTSRARFCYSSKKLYSENNSNILTYDDGDLSVNNQAAGQGPAPQTLEFSTNRRSNSSECEMLGIKKTTITILVFIHLGLI